MRLNITRSFLLAASLICLFPKSSAAQLAAHNPDWKIIEKNNTWWRYSWKVTIANDYNADRGVIVRVKFLDFQGFIVDEDLAVETVPAFHYKEIIGSALISVPKAEKVYKMTAEVR